MEAEGDITIEADVGMEDRTTVDTGVGMDVEVLEEVMVMAEAVDAGAGTMEGLDKMAARMVEDLEWVVEVEVVVEQVVCRVDQGVVGMLQL